MSMRSGRRASEGSRSETLSGRTSEEVEVESGMEDDHRHDGDTPDDIDLPVALSGISPRRQKNSPDRGPAVRAGLHIGDLLLLLLGRFVIDPVNPHSRLHSRTMNGLQIRP